jgi:hypothetical protein
MFNRVHGGLGEVPVSGSSPIFPHVAAFDHPRSVCFPESFCDWSGFTRPDDSVGSFSFNFP